MLTPPHTPASACPAAPWLLLQRLHPRVHAAGGGRRGPPAPPLRLWQHSCGITRVGHCLLLLLYPRALHCRSSGPQAREAL